MIAKKQPSIYLHFSLLFQFNDFPHFLLLSGGRSSLKVEYFLIGLESGTLLREYIGVG